MSQEVLKIGVIGAGTQGGYQVQCFQSLHNAKVVAVVDIDQERAHAVAKRHKVSEVYTDYNEMLARSKLDAVSVVLPDHLHLGPGLAVIDAGRHLLMEKPLATIVEEGEKLVKAARAKDIRMMVNFSNRFMLPMQVAYQAFRSGQLGEPVYAYLRLSNTLSVPTKMIRPWVSHTKLPFWLMSHLVDRIRWIWGSDPKRVFAVARSGVLEGMGIDTPDFYHGTVEFDNGAVATFESCWILPQSSPMGVDSKMNMIFTRGAVTIDAQQTTIQIATKESFSYPYTLSGMVQGHPVGFVLESLRHFVDSVLKGVDPGPSGEDGLAVLKTTAAIVESAEKGMPVEIG